MRQTTTTTTTMSGDVNNELKRQADYHKDIGNKHFKSGNIDESINCYTKAIDLFDSNVLIFCNRAMAYLKKQRPLEALDDCNKALEIDSKCIKAIYRRAMANKCLYRYLAAIDDFKQVLGLDPDNKEAKRELQAITDLINQKAIVDIRPIDKPLEYRSAKPMVRLNVTDVLSDQIKIGLPMKLPTKLPENYYQFECDWRQLSDGHNNTDDGDGKHHLRCDYLEMIGSDRMQTLFQTTCLEPEMMSELLSTIAASNDHRLVYTVLSQMAKTPRFDTIALFMSQTDKLTVKQIVERLEQNNFDVDLVSEIKNYYFK
ncbi:RNA polymerase II-associated protein 3-like [Oppia nitens]|uniref:RNA polymerase II-associated protein 3-like n=1 Tax=Oppia nitens TaxID=1686743 RepID=UPI0023D9F90D|nr:RNA polymerase II-associated protein 3-like [Oppia nitens]